MPTKRERDDEPDSERPDPVDDPERDEGDADEAEEAEERPRPRAKPKQKSKARVARPRSPSSRSRDEDDYDDEDDEDEDDDEDGDDEEYEDRRARSRRARSRRPERPRRRRSPKRPPPLTEEQIDSPKKQTLYMLGAVAATTVVLWGAARFACNAHPPGSKAARPAPISVVARDPKGAAVELQQQWTAYQFAGALELARGDVADQLLKDLQSCEADLKTCEANREKLAGKVISVGELISREGRTAKVRVKTTAEGETKTFLLDLKSEGSQWKVVKRSPATE